MKKISKHTEEFRLLDVARALNVKSLDDIETIKKSFSEALNNNDDKIKLYGSNTDTFFSRVLATLDNCVLIKKEDTNDDLYVSKDLEVPDYRVVLKDDTQYLIEVKNCNKTKKVFKNDYISRLLEYSKLTQAKLLIAIYWNKFNLWSLIEPADLSSSSSKRVIDINNALKKNKMYLFGDISVGLKPPIKIRLINDIVKSESKDENSSSLITQIKDLEIIYNEKVVNDQSLKNTLFVLMFYGDWKNDRVETTMNGDEVYIDYIFEPYEDQQIPSLLMPLSSIITKYHKLVCYGYDKKKMGIEPKIMHLDLSSIKQFTGSDEFPLRIFKMVP